MIQCEWFASDSDHLEIADSDGVDVILLREIRSSADFRVLQGLVTDT